MAGYPFLLVAGPLGAPIPTAGWLEYPGISVSGLLETTTGSLSGGYALSVARPAVLSAATSDAAGYFIAVSVTADSLSALGLLSGGSVASVAQSGLLPELQASLGAGFQFSFYSPTATLNANGSVTATLRVSVAKLVEVLSALSALSAGYAISVSVPGSVLAGSDLTAGWAEERYIPASPLVLFNSLSGGYQIDVSVGAALDAITSLSGVAAQNAMFSGLLEASALLSGTVLVTFPPVLDAANPGLTSVTADLSLAPIPNGYDIIVLPVEYGIVNASQAFLLVSVPPDIDTRH